MSTDEQSTVTGEQVDQPDTSTDDGVTKPSGDSDQSQGSTRQSADDMQSIIVESFEKRLDAGTLTLEEIRGGNQAWIADKIELKRAKAPKEDSTTDFDSLKEELKSELKVEAEMDDLKAMRLSKDVLAQVEEDFGKYKDTLGAAEALKLARKLSGVDTSSEARQRRAMRLRELGGGVDESTVQVNEFDQSLEKKNPYVKAETNAARRQTLESGQPLILK